MNEPKESSSYRGLKRLLPKSLLGRAMLILVTPTALIQLIAAYVFYERHWDSVVRNMSASLAGEIASVVHEVQHTDESERNYRKELAHQFMGMTIAFYPGEHLPAHPVKESRFEDFEYHLRRLVTHPFYVQQIVPDNDISIMIQLPDAVMEVIVTKKRLVSSTTYIFTLWLLGSALILLLVAIVFMRNQIRPISELARAAEGFGTGRDTPGFRPAGAREVRQASHAFLTMRGRIKRQMETRTAMLSGISHDLRTPLTRMKLQLEMLEPSDAIAGLKRDVADMQQMVQEYLDFIRGEEGEEAVDADLNGFLKKVIEPHERNRDPIALETGQSATLPIRPGNLKRAIDNLITNAIRYGAGCVVRTALTDNHALIFVEDEGPGIPESSFEHVFKPFKRLDESRNLDHGGAGLGLTIAQDIVRAHGGDIALKNLLREDGTIRGLQVKVRLPLSR